MKDNIVIKCVVKNTKAQTENLLLTVLYLTETSL